MDNICSISGLTKQEKLTHEKLMEFYEEYLKLERQHPSELHDLVHFIHNIQGLFCKKIVRRVYNDFWPMYKWKKDESI